MSTLPFSIKHFCVGILISISSLVASAFVPSSLLYGQTVTFAGTQKTLPSSGVYLWHPQGIAVDNAGDVFIADQGGSQVVEVPRTEGGLRAADDPAVQCSGIPHRSRRGQRRGCLHRRHRE